MFSILVIILINFFLLFLRRRLYYPSILRKDLKRLKIESEANELFFANISFLGLLPILIVILKNLY